MAYTESAYARNRRYLNGDDAALPSIGENPGQRSYSTGEIQIGTPAGNNAAEPEATQPTTTTSLQPEAPSTGETKKPFGSAAPSLIQRHGSLNERLFDPISQGVSDYEADLSGLRDTFRDEAGSERSFDSVGGEEILGRAIGGGPTEEARDLVGAGYSGPVGLSSESVAEAQARGRELQSRDEALQSGGGLVSLLSSSVPGLTAGQARFEAQRLLDDPGFRSQRDESRRATSGLGGQIETATREAADYADTRAAQEQSIADQSRDYLQQQRANIYTDLDQEAARRNAENERLRDIYLQIQQEGAVSPQHHYLFGRGGTQQNMRSGFSSPIPSEEERLSSEMYRFINQTMNAPRYSSISDLPMGEQIGISSHGRERYEGEDGRLLKKQLKEEYGIDNSQWRLWKARQAELDAQLRAAPTGGKQGREAEEAAEAGEPLGRFAAVSDHGDQGLDPFEGPDITDYIDFKEGVLASRENVATETQRDRIASINDLLDSADSLAEAGNPWQAAKISTAVDKYLEAEETALEQRSGEESKQAEQWRRTLKKARRRYRNSQSGWAFENIIDNWGPAAAGFALGGVPGFIGGMAAGELID